MAGLASVAATLAKTAAMHASLTGHGIESVILMTCNRVELFWRSRTPQDDVVATGTLAAAIGTGAEQLLGASAWLAGERAAGHLFRVCAGLESVVIGEAEVLGQTRAALEASPGAGRFVAGVFRAAIRAGRAARAETGIGKGAASVASTAIQWLSARAALDTSRVLIVGAGDTARKVARHLKAVGLRDLVVANRSLARAQDLARALGAEAVGLDSLPDEILRADAIVSAVNVSQWVITREQLRHRSDRPDRPLFVVDLAMPPSVEPTECCGITRLDLGVIEQLTCARREQRSAELPRVEAVLAREMAWLQKWTAREALRCQGSRSDGSVMAHRVES